MFYYLLAYLISIIFFFIFAIINLFFIKNDNDKLKIGGYREIKTLISSQNIKNLLINDYNYTFNSYTEAEAEAKAAEYEIIVDIENIILGDFTNFFTHINIPENLEHVEHVDYKHSDAMNYYTLIMYHLMANKHYTDNKNKDNENYKPNDEWLENIIKYHNFKNKNIICPDISSGIQSDCTLDYIMLVYICYIFVIIKAIYLKKEIYDKENMKLTFNMVSKQNLIIDINNNIINLRTFINYTFNLINEDIIKKLETYIPKILQQKNIIQNNINITIKINHCILTRPSKIQRELLFTGADDLLIMAEFIKAVVEKKEKKQVCIYTGDISYFSNFYQIADIPSSVVIYIINEKNKVYKMLPDVFLKHFKTNKHLINEYQCFIFQNIININDKTDNYYDSEEDKKKKKAEMEIAENIEEAKKKEEAKEILDTLLAIIAKLKEVSPTFEKWYEFIKK